MIYGKGQTDYIQERFIRFDIPFLSDIPVIGPMFFKDVYGTSILRLFYRLSLGLLFIKLHLVYVFVLLGNIQWQQIRWG